MDAMRFRWYFNKILAHQDGLFGTPLFKQSEALAKFNIKAYVLNKDLKLLRDALGIDLIPMNIYSGERTKGTKRHKVIVDRVFLPRLVTEYEVTYFDSKDRQTTRIADARYRDSWVFKVNLGGRRVGQGSHRCITVPPRMIISITPAPPDWERVTDIESLEFRTTEMLIEKFGNQ